MESMLLSQLAFLLILAIFSTAFHWKINNRFLAALLSAIPSAALSVFGNHLVWGADAFWPIALFFKSVFGVVVSLILSIFIKLIKEDIENKQKRKTQIE